MNDVNLGGPRATTPAGQRSIGGRYRLINRIGSGGMGTVWRAHDEVLLRDVAVKEVTLPPGLPAQDRDTLCQRTMREARAAAALSHPSVVRVFDVVQDDNRPWIVMELLEARSLADVISADGPLPSRTVAAVGLALLGALEAAHRIGVLHRDVKPANVMVAADGKTTLTDFGVASAPGDTSLTHTGLLLGSPQYIAPERARGQAFGSASDLFSLGATLYAALAGGPPFDRGDPMLTLTAVVSEEPKPIPSAGSLMPVLTGLLTKDPKRRFTHDQAREGLSVVLDADQVADTDADQARRAALVAATIKAGKDGDAIEAAKPASPAPLPRITPARRHRHAAPRGDASGDDSAPARSTTDSSAATAHPPVQSPRASTSAPAQSPWSSTPGPVESSRTSAKSSAPQQQAPAGFRHGSAAIGRPTRQPGEDSRPVVEDPRPTSDAPRERGDHQPSYAPAAMNGTTTYNRQRTSAPRPPGGARSGPIGGAALGERLADLRATVRRQPTLVVALGAAAVVLTVVVATGLVVANLVGGPADDTGTSNAAANSQDGKLVDYEPADGELSTGFGLKIPVDWRSDHGKKQVRIYEASKKVWIQLYKEKPGDSTQHAVWASGERRQKRGIKGGGDYQRVKFADSTLGSAKALDWEWTYLRDGETERRHALYRGTVIDGVSYQIALSAPRSQFPKYRGLFEQISKTFQIAG